MFTQSEGSPHHDYPKAVRPTSGPARRKRQHQGVRPHLLGLVTRLLSAHPHLLQSSWVWRPLCSSRGRCAPKDVGMYVYVHCGCVVQVLAATAPVDDQCMSTESSCRTDKLEGTRTMLHIPLDQDLHVADDHVGDHAIEELTAQQTK